MPSRLTAEAIEKARDEADQWEDFKDGATLSAAGVVPAIAAVTTPAVAAICGAAAASMIMLGSKKARISRRKAEDPPDPNYWIPVRARRAHFNSEAFGNTPLEQATVAASYALLYAIAYEGAVVRGLERAEAAKEQGDRENETLRLEEAREYGRKAAESNYDVERTTGTLARRFEELDVGRKPPEDAIPLPRRLDLALPDETLVILFRAGFRIEELRVPVRPRPAPDDPIGHIADGLRRSGTASREFGAELLSWAEELG